MITIWLFVGAIYNASTCTALYGLCITLLLAISGVIPPWFCLWCSVFFFLYAWYGENFDAQCILPISDLLSEIQLEHATTVNLFPCSSARYDINAKSTFYMCFISQPKHVILISIYSSIIKLQFVLVHKVCTIQNVCLQKKLKEIKQQI